MVSTEGIMKSLPFQIGCTQDGILNGIEATVYANCGFSSIDSALSATILQVDNGRSVIDLQQLLLI